MVIPKISVIIPMFNVEKYIEKTLNSVIEQTFKDFEIILINDGSTDRTVDICQEYLNKYNNIMLFEQKNKGVSSARNLGIDKANSKYIIFIDADDLLEKDMLEVLYEDIVKNNADMSICGYIIKNLDDTIIYHYNTNLYKLFDKTMIMQEFLRERLFGIALWNKLIKADIVKKHKFDESLKINEDKKFLFSVISECKNVIYNDVCKYKYILRKNSAATAKFDNRMFDVIKVNDYIFKTLKDCDSDIKSLISKNVISNYIMLYRIMTLASNRKEYILEYNELRQKILNFDISKCEKNISKLNRLEINMIKRIPHIYIVLFKLLKKFTIIKKIKNKIDIKKLRKI